MQGLEKILEEIDAEIEKYRENPSSEIVNICYGMNRAKDIIRRHMNGKDINVSTNDGWIPVEKRLP